MSTDTTTPTESTTNPPTFAALGVEDALSGALADTGITTAFPIQALTLPLALTGADVIGQARTGTGKTLAFGLALLQRIDPDGTTPQALVIVPTRELCLQVSKDLEIGRVKGLEVVSIYGGVGYDKQLDALKRGAHIVVGTPGRLLDLKQRGDLDLSNVRELVLDEADEMLDMGFLPDVEQLIGGCPDDRHTMLFSATMPTEVVRLGRRYMDQPTFMRADQEEHETAPTVTQHFFKVHRMDKPRILARLLQSPDRGGCYVFVRTKAMADRLVRDLDDLGVSAVAVHGDLRQLSREKNLQKFRDGKADVLVATEVAARGLDVDNVSHVVNYDCPDDEKMYLHRIGRTARAGSEGVAVTFAQFNEVERASLIRKALGVTEPVREIFSTSDELTELFDLPNETPWDHKGSKSLVPESDLPIGKVADAPTDDATPTETSSTKTPSSGRSRSSGGGRDRGRSNRQAEDKPTSRATSDDTSTTSERTRTRTRTRSRDAGSSTDGDGKQAGTRSKSPGRERDRKQGGKGGSSTSGSGRSGGSKSSSKSSGSSSGGRSSRNRGKGGSSKGRSGNGNDGRNNRRRKVSIEEARDGGQPRPARRVKVEHLP